jgi:hypothetical protein
MNLPRLFISERPDHIRIISFSDNTQQPMKRRIIGCAKLGLYTERSCAPKHPSLVQARLKPVLERRRLCSEQNCKELGPEKTFDLRLTLSRPSVKLRVCLGQVQAVRSAIRQIGSRSLKTR